MILLTRCLVKIPIRPNVKSLIVLSFICGFLTPFSYADDILSGHYCYTCQSHETLEECRFLTRTLAVRHAIESYDGFVQTRGQVKDRGQLNDIIQMIATGYIRDLGIIKHREEGRLICENIQAKISKKEVDHVLAREMKKRNRDIEMLGIDNNGCLKILRATEPRKDRYGYRIQIVVKVLRKTGSLADPDERNNQPCFKICVDFFDENGFPIGGETRFIHESDVGLIPGEIRMFYFYLPPEVKSYRVWLEGSKKKTKTGSPRRLSFKQPSSMSKDDVGTAPENSEEYYRFKGIQTGNAEGGFQIEVVAHGHIKKYTHFFMNTPPRLVLDLPGNWERPRDDLFNINHVWVKRIRVGRHPNKLRLVFDLVEEASFPPAVIQESPKGLLITIGNQI